MGKMTDALRKAMLLKEQKAGHSPAAPPGIEPAPSLSRESAKREPVVEKTEPKPVSPPKPSTVIIDRTHRLWTAREDRMRGVGVLPQVEEEIQVPPVKREKPTFSTLIFPEVAAEELKTEVPGVLPEVEPTSEPVVEQVPGPETVLPEVEPTPVDATSPYLSVHCHKDDRTADEFRRLKSRLTDRSSPARLILVGSCTRGEGKTTVAMNLAISFANTYGEKVVLVDGNVAHPKIAEVLKVPARGLEEVIRGHIRPEEAAVRTDIAGLWVVPAGEDLERSEGLLDSKSVIELLGVLQKRFTRVIMELPAVSDAPECLSLVAHADAVLVPVLRGRTRRTKLLRLLGRIKDNGAPKVHCVFVEV